ncbi:MAG: hypothetical protein K2M01_06395 [Paramuribaculum sp.]|nr:hypothetical protein [Paramuribaculum sp.]
MKTLSKILIATGLIIFGSGLGVALVTPNHKPSEKPVSKKSSHKQEK